MKCSHRVQEIINNSENVSDKCKHDLLVYLNLINELSKTASKKTHYVNLEEWTSSAYGFIHKMLKKYKFVNGDPEANSKLPNASFWWNIFWILSSIQYSPNLNTNVEPHHSSAWERNEALKLDIEYIVNALNIK
jgi:hypothetical protein